MSPEVAVTGWEIRTAPGLPLEPSWTRGAGGRTVPPTGSAIVEVARELLAVRRAGPLPELAPELEVRLGTIRGSRATDLAFLGSLSERGVGLGSPSLFVHTLSTAALAEMSIGLGIRGPAATVSGGEASGLLAVALGAGFVASGRASACLCGAVDVSGSEDDVIALFLVERARPEVRAPRIQGWTASFDATERSSPTSLRWSMEQLVHALGSREGGPVLASSRTGESVRLSVVPGAFHW